MQENKPKVLVVDDEPDVVESLSDYLGSKGFQVFGALSGEQALNILEKERADLILMDIMMPVLKGTEVSRLIKNKYPSVKVVILTAYPKEAEGLLKENVTDTVLTKPTGIDVIFEKLSDILEPSVSERAKQGMEARVLFIRGKLLVFDADRAGSDNLTSRLKSLDGRGEYYDVKQVFSSDNLSEAVASFDPDLILGNSSFVNSLAPGKGKDILDNFLKQGKAIIYDSAQLLDNNRLEGLIKTIQIYSFRNGLIEVKWVRI